MSEIKSLSNGNHWSALELWHLVSCWGRGNRSASIAPCQAASTSPRWGEETGNTPAERPRPHDSTCPYVLAQAQSGPWGNKDDGIESLTHWTVPRSDGEERWRGGGGGVLAVMFSQGMHGQGVVHPRKSYITHWSVLNFAQLSLSYILFCVYSCCRLFSFIRHGVPLRL